MADSEVEPKRRRASPKSGKARTARRRPASSARALSGKGAIQAAIMDVTDVMLVYLDRDFNFVMVNAAYAEACRKSPEELIGRNHFALYPDPETEAIFRRVRDTGEPAFYQDKPFEFPDQPERGVTYWSWSLKPVKDEAGSVAGLVFSLRETTRYKKAELARKESEERFRQMAENCNEIIFQIDSQGNITYISPAVRTLGYEPEQILGRSFSEFVPPEDLKSAREVFQRVKKGESLKEEMRILRGDSSIVVCEISSTPMIRGGRVVGVQGVTRDISARKRAEEELRRLNQTLRALVESRRAMMSAEDEAAYLTKICRVIVDDCGFTMVWIGYAEDDANRSVRPIAQAGLGAEYLQSLHISWGDNPRGSSAISRAIRSGKPVLCRDVQGDPDLAPWHWHARMHGYASVLGLPLKMGERTFGGIAILSPDREGFPAEQVEMFTELAEDVVQGIITLRGRQSREKAEGDLRRNETQLQTILDNLTEGLVVADLESDLFFWNPAAVAMHGFADVEEGRRKLQDLTDTFELSTIPEGILPLAEWPLSRILNGETLHGWEVRVRRLDSDWQRVFSYSGTLARDRHGKPVLAVVIISDVTERKMFEEALVRSKQEWERTFDAVPDLICVLDNKHRVIRANRAMSERLKMSIQEIVGLQCFSCVHGASSPPLNCPHARTLLDGREHSAELHEPKLGGDFLVTTTPLHDEEGQMIGSVHVSRDITERKQAEEKIRRLNEDLKAGLFQLEGLNLELERSNKDLQQFAFVISHDLQAPLHTVASFVQLLKRRYRGRLDEKGDLYIEQIFEGTRLMQQLLQDLLAFSRVGGGQLKLRPLPLGDVVDRVLSNLDQGIRAQGAEILVEDHLPVVNADESQILHLLQNLVANAIKFRGEDAPQVEIFTRDAEGEWVVCVRDNGIGIDPHYGERIFQMFQRLHGRDRYEGSGIGLAICKKIVERHGGRIWVESSPSEGSTFCFSLPARREKKS